MKTPKWFAVVCVSFLVARDAAAQSPKVAATAGEKRNAIVGSPATTTSGSAALPLVNSLQLVLQSPPAASVDSVAVSPDGSLVATASGEGGVRLYDARSGELRRALGEVGDRCVDFSPDGRMLAAAGFHMDKLVKLVDVQSGKIVRTFAGHSQIETCAVAFSPDGKQLASACRDHEVLVWDVSTGALKYRIDSAPSIALAYSPDSRTLAGGCADRTIRLWDAATGELRREFQGHSDSVVSLSFSPDGETMASGSCDWANHRGRDTANFAWRDPGCISEWKIWNVAKGQLQRSEQVPGRLLRLAFAPDGQSLAGAIGKEVQLYELARKRPARTIASYDFDATSVAFTPDGSSIVSGSHDQTLKRVNVASGQVEWEAPGDWEQINSIALSADGSFLVTGSSDRRFAVRTLTAGDRGLRPGAARLWDARTGRLLRRLGHAGEQVMAVAVSPSGKQIVSSGLNGNGSGFVHMFDVSGSVSWTMSDHSSEVLTAVFAADGSMLATGAADGTVKLRDPQSGAVVRALPGHLGGATAIAFTPNGAVLVCGQGQGGARVWETRTGRLLHTCLAADSRAASVTTDRLFTSIAIPSDGATFLECAASVGNTYGEPARIWDLRTGKWLRSLKGGRPIVLSPDGSLLAAGGKTVSLQNVQSGDETRRLTGYLKKVQSIAFSPDGRLIFSGGSYGTVNAWEVATGRHLVTLFAFPQQASSTPSDEWLAYRPEGYYDGSPNVQRYLGWRVGDEFHSPQSLGRQLHQPEQVTAALTLQANR